ncbi:MAG: methyl-accepting chemotaxis protein [Bacillota bacterium]|nr:methyl-accepting chemotaxis protein [Bacillota bacterium]MDW7685035.1 methyl-accepting chemotaxis protein [Bacillota bacterium]
MYQEKISALDAFTVAAPYINELLIDDVAVAVVDAATLKYVQYVSGKTIAFPVKVGELCPEQTITMEAIKQKRKVVKKAGAETFGFPYMSIGMPLMDENEQVIGSVSFNTSLQRQNQVMEMSAGLDEIIRKVSEEITNMAGEAQELHAVGKELSALAEELRDKMEETNKVIEVMNNITSQTKLLGLNASIEAARAGKEGLGFGVVAHEIGKLSESSANSLNQINTILKVLRDAQQKQNTEVNKVDRIAEGQALLAQNIADSVLIIEEKSNRLVNLAGVIDIESEK